jgi:hypothetical protein
MNIVQKKIWKRKKAIAKGKGTPPGSLVETTQQLLSGGPRPASTNLSSDASELTIKKLTQMSPVDLNLLLFLNCELSVLDQVFPKRHCLGDLDPPTK